jgi:hypothetical protein
MPQEVIEWNGKKYTRIPKPGCKNSRLYFYRREQTNLKRVCISMHREVWEFYNGKIPDKMHIHHIDGNPANNAIENLEILTAKEHIKKHPWSMEKLEKQNKHLADIRPAATAWHSTKEGIATNTRISREFRDSPKGQGFHKRIAKLSYINFVPITKNCLFCGKEFKTTRHDHANQFCSRICVSANRRESGVDNVNRICKFCSKEFEVNKYQTRQTCSRQCTTSYKKLIL